MWPAIIGAAGSVLGGILGYKGQQDTNTANRQLARENRDWQEHMSNTAYRRATRDMTKAGLNPILAYQQGGAGTPAGSIIPMENPAKDAASVGRDATANLINFQRAKAEIELMKTNSALNMEKVQTEKTAQATNTASAGYTASQTQFMPDIWSAQAENYESQTLKLWAEMGNLAREGKRLDAVVTIAQAEAFAKSIENALDRTDPGTLSIQLNRLGIPLSGLGAILSKSKAGQALIATYGGALGLTLAKPVSVDDRPKRRSLYDFYG